MSLNLEVLEDLARSYWREIDSSNIVPDHVISKLKSEGALSPGEVGLDEILEAVRVVSRYSPGLAHVILVNASAWLATGGSRGGVYAFSITEPGGGTDIAANLKTVAIKAKSGYEISGVKIFTSNAPYADYFVVLASYENAPTLFLAARQDRIRYEVLEVLGLRGSGASRVEYDNANAELAGTPGKGIREALRGINLGRAGYGMIALGIADRALEVIRDAASNKIIFGRPLMEYQGVKWTAAELEINRRMLESLLDKIKKSVSTNGEPDPMLAAIAKVAGASLAQKASWAASQILGGRGVSRGAETERMMRDSRILDIGEGAREVLLDFIGGRVLKRKQ